MENFCMLKGKKCYNIVLTKEKMHGSQRKGTQLIHTMKKKTLKCFTLKNGI
jgi:hypothetical protein